MATRRRRPFLKAVQCRNNYIANIPLMTKLLNWHPPIPYVAFTTVSYCKNTLGRVYRNEEPSPEGQRDKEIPLS